MSYVFPSYPCSSLLGTVPSDVRAPTAGLQRARRGPTQLRAAVAARPVIFAADRIVGRHVHSHDRRRWRLGVVVV